MPKRTSTLIDAAIALEEQLEDLGALARKAQKLPLDSLENIRKTTDTLSQVGGMEQQLTARLQALVAAIAELSQRQQQQVEQLAARAEELAARRAAHDALAERYGGLGQSASELNTSIHQFLETQAQAPASEARAMAGLTARQISTELAKVIASADDVHASAVAAHFPELERQTHALRQQLGAARTRIDQHAQNLETRLS